MKRGLFLIVALVMAISLSACDGIKEPDSSPSATLEATPPSSAEPPATAYFTPDEASQTEVTEMQKLAITVGNTKFTATMADNSSAKALMKLLYEKPLTIKMQDYGGFEKVGPIGQNLLANDEQISTTAGDLILYQGNQFVIYYSSNSWSFTRLGRMDNVTADDLKKVLGSGDVTVTLSIAER
ncbi:MAG: hypothetical protein LBK69_02955 [Syntrophomonadaceae bacterium]|jgi:hypothetical protein|nr:hypothetical protein [Syntrophomonadaceae bacterium]